MAQQTTSFEPQTQPELKQGSHLFLKKVGKDLRLFNKGKDVTGSFPELKGSGSMSETLARIRSDHSNFNSKFKLSYFNSKSKKIVTETVVNTNGRPSINDMIVQNLAKQPDSIEEVEAARDGTARSKRVEPVTLPEKLPPEKPQAKKKVKKGGSLANQTGARVTARLKKEAAEEAAEKTVVKAAKPSLVKKKVRAKVTPKKPLKGQAATASAKAEREKLEQKSDPEGLTKKQRADKNKADADKAQTTKAAADKTPKPASKTTVVDKLKAVKSKGGLAKTLLTFGAGGLAGAGLSGVGNTAPPTAPIQLQLLQEYLAGQKPPPEIDVKKYQTLHDNYNKAETQGLNDERDQSLELLQDYKTKSQGLTDERAAAFERNKQQAPDGVKFDPVTQALSDLASAEGSYGDVMLAIALGNRTGRADNKATNAAAQKAFAEHQQARQTAQNDNTAANQREDLGLLTTGTANTQSNHAAGQETLRTTNLNNAEGLADMLGNQANLNHSSGEAQRLQALELMQNLPPEALAYLQKEANTQAQQQAQQAQPQAQPQPQLNPADLGRQHVQSLGQGAANIAGAIGTGATNALQYGGGAMGAITDALTGGSPAGQPHLPPAGSGLPPEVEQLLQNLPPESKQPFIDLLRQQLGSQQPAIPPSMNPRNTPQVPIPSELLGG